MHLRVSEGRDALVVADFAKRRHPVCTLSIKWRIELPPPGAEARAPAARPGTPVTPVPESCVPDPNFFDLEDGLD
jgi:hypothetical protein